MQLPRGASGQSPEVTCPSFSGCGREAETINLIAGENSRRPRRHKAEHVGQVSHQRPISICAFASTQFFRGAASAVSEIANARRASPPTPMRPGRVVAFFGGHVHTFGQAATQSPRSAHPRAFDRFTRPRKEFCRAITGDHVAVAERRRARHLIDVPAAQDDGETAYTLALENSPYRRACSAETCVS